jgi:hypothetical protein
MLMSLRRAAIAFRAADLSLKVSSDPTTILRCFLFAPEQDSLQREGDWVTNYSGSSERVFMGATYRYNPEDAAAFRLLPATDSDYLFRQITIRCVSE